ncbi:hypothetical protein, partial [Microcoleus sp. MON2_D5]|uniref:hypothetical protein n=1 Tax=Microcoleus sp. MON2_D5 TaxID=2818833 RepID=UPI002FD344D0
SSFFTVLLAFSFWRFFHIFAKVRCTRFISRSTNLILRLDAVFIPPQVEAGINATHPQLLSKTPHNLIKNSSSCYPLFVIFTVIYDTDRPSCPNLHNGRIFNI